MPRRGYRRTRRNRDDRIAAYAQIARDVALGLAALGAYIGYVQKSILWQAVGLLGFLGAVGLVDGMAFAIHRIRQRTRANRSK